MTKQVHIINADNAPWRVTVNVEEQQYTSAGMEWKPVKSLRLDNPGQLLTEYLTSGRRIIIEESGKVV